MCFLPRRALNVSDCEIARAYKVAASGIEAIAFIVPRKVLLDADLRTHTHTYIQADSFQSDIYPLAPSSEPALTAGEFFSGKTAPPNLVSLGDGTIHTGTAPSVPPPSSPAAPLPTRTVSAPVPSTGQGHVAANPFGQGPDSHIRTTLDPSGGRAMVSPEVETESPFRSQSTSDVSHLPDPSYLKLMLMVFFRSAQES